MDHGESGKLESVRAASGDDEILDSSWSKLSSGESSGDTTKSESANKAV
jgi:hypothetical protein